MSFQVLSCQYRLVKQYMNRITHVPNVTMISQHVCNSLSNYIYIVAAYFDRAPSLIDTVLCIMHYGMIIHIFTFCATCEC